MNVHVRDEPDEPPIQTCLICNGSFSSVDALQIHYNQSHESFPSARQGAASTTSVSIPSTSRKVVQAIPIHQTTRIISSNKDYPITYDERKSFTDDEEHSSTGNRAVISKYAEPVSEFTSPAAHEVRYQYYKYMYMH